MRAEPLTVALLGCGTVGAEVARLLEEQAEDLTARVGAPLRILGIAVRDLAKPRPGIDRSLLTDDPDALMRRGADVVVELMGGIEPARSLMLTAMAHGSSVVTANKALLAEEGAALHESAAKNEVDLYYEASVAGAIPLLRSLRESLAGDRVRRVLGIVNGTTNYILTRMDETGADFDEALKEATALGYAEADPTADVGGHDAAAKAAIIAGLAFHTRVLAGDVAREGITGVSADDVATAATMGQVVKLLAIAELGPDGHDLFVRVHPAMVPRTHPLAGVREAFNAVFVETEAAGELMFYGRGAGGTPTASAVLGDLVAVARNRLAGARGWGESVYADVTVRQPGESVTAYYVNLAVADRPGVLATVASVFGEHGVSIRIVRQEGLGEEARLVLVTHRGREADLAATVEALRGLEIVRAVTSVLRVEGDQA